MLVPRPVHLCICLISLAVAGCADTRVPETQSSAGGAASRPKMMLVNDFVLPSHALVDRDFAARLESKLDNYPLTNDVIELMAAKRVNDEMVATIIVIVGAAGLNARSRGQEDSRLRMALWSSAADCTPPIRATAHSATRSVSMPAAALSPTSQCRKSPTARRSNYSPLRSKRRAGASPAPRLQELNVPRSARR